MAGTNEDIQRSLSSILHSQGNSYVFSEALFRKLIEIPKKGKRCIFCNHRKDEGFVLPSSQGIRPSASWLFHFRDTHGYEPEVSIQWLMLAPYVHRTTGALAINLPGVFGRTT